MYSTNSAFWDPCRGIFTAGNAWLTAGGLVVSQFDTPFASNTDLVMFRVTPSAKATPPPASTATLRLNTARSMLALQGPKPKKPPPIRAELPLKVTLEKVAGVSAWQ